MTTEKQLFRVFRDATRPVDAQVQQVKRRLRQEGWLADDADKPLRDLQPPLGSLARLRLRLWREPFHRPRPAWTAFALAAALVAAVWAWPRVHGLAERLESTETWAWMAPTPQVALGFQGVGNLSGTNREPTITWESGTLEVEVTPNRGIHLVVETREGRVRVTGTAFAVVRNPLGTEVRVTRGSVDVACHAGTSAHLQADDHLTCPPVSSAGWLARARRQQDENADPEEILASTAAGMALASPTDAVGDELGAVHIRILAQLGQNDEALREAEAYLSRPRATRAREVRSLAAHLALVAGGCARAHLHLQVLAVEDPDAAATLAACEGTHP